MNREELVENLGTIAHSGSKKFLEAMKEGDAAKDNLIGQFGVGFYSTFMAAEKVQVYTHSWDPAESGLVWESEGAGSYTIEEAEGQRRGTKNRCSPKGRMQGVRHRGKNQTYHQAVF